MCYANYFIYFLERELDYVKKTMGDDMTRFAIILSVEEYDQFRSTPYTHDDNDLICNTLTKKCDYAEQHILALKLSPDSAKTPADILSEIKNTVSNSKSGDSVLLYFAGHGHFQDNKSYLILPNTVKDSYETTALLLDDLSKELKGQGRSFFRIFDACHSGQDVRKIDDSPNSRDFIKDISHSPSGWVTIAACAEDQESTADPLIGNGVFTHYLCEEISSFENNEEIYPEALKLNIVEKVFIRSSELGVPQTVTINASISGNISLATRKIIIETNNTDNVIKNEETENLDQKIIALSSVIDVLTNEKLENTLNIVSEQCISDLKKINIYKNEPLIGNKIKANEIPYPMRSHIVHYSYSIRNQPRHDLERIEEEHEAPFNPLTYSLFQPKRMVKSTRYIIQQPNDMPPSALIIELIGDKRCLPNIKILVYIVPLQITACVFILAFNFGWRNDLSDIQIISKCHQKIKPDHTEKMIAEISSAAISEITNNIFKIVKSRAERLEKELMD